MWDCDPVGQNRKWCLVHINTYFLPCVRKSALHQFMCVWLKKAWYSYNIVGGCDGRKFWSSWPQCKTNTSESVKGGGGQETGSSVGWGPVTVWVIMLSLPWQPQSPFPFSGCCSWVVAHLLSLVHLAEKMSFKHRVRHITVPHQKYHNHFFKSKITNLHLYHFICFHSYKKWIKI